MSRIRDCLAAMAASCPTCKGAGRVALSNHDPSSGEVDYAGHAPCGHCGAAREALQSSPYVWKALENDLVDDAFCVTVDGCTLRAEWMNGSRWHCHVQGPCGGILFTSADSGEPRPLSDVSARKLAEAMHARWRLS